MFDYLLCRHEAGHAVVAAALGLRHHARVKDDGSGAVNWGPGALAGLHAEDRAVLAVAGNVAEAMAIDGNLKRAVKDTLEKDDSNDALILRNALSELPAYKYGRQGPALLAAAKAREVILQNKAEFDRLTDTLQRDGIGQVRMVAPARRPSPSGVDYTANLAAVRSGQAVGAAELRSLASRAAADGNQKLAKLIDQTLARREGRAVTPIRETSIGGPLYVVS